jgi:hypothetical protein
MIRLISVLLALLTTACQVPPSQQEISPAFKVPPGSTLILNQDLLIPANRTKIFVQGGRLAYGANGYYPYCRFSVRDIQPDPQRVAAGEFAIYRTERVRDLFAALDKSQMLAAVFSGNGRGDGKPSPITYGTRMYLRSAEQPHVFRMLCGHLQDPNLTARDLTVKQIRQTLGEVFTLRLPGEPVNSDAPQGG